MQDSNNMQSTSAAPNSEVEGQLIKISVETATNGVFLDQNDADLFAAVKNGDTNLVKSKLNDVNSPMNIDAINSDGETALQIATKIGNSDIIHELLKNGANLYTALSQCVLENNLECVKELLSKKPEHKFAELEELIIQAAELGHYDIVHFFLIQKDCKINEPHDFECNKKCCKPTECKEKTYASYAADVRRSKIAINRFKGLSCPVYMCVR